MTASPPPPTDAEHSPGRVPADGPAVLTTIVVTYNSASHLRETLGGLVGVLRSLEGRGLRTNLCVVDNASTDGSPDVARAVAPAAQVLVMERNLGYGAAANVGAGATQGEWIAVLNPDVDVQRLVPDALAVALNGRTPQDAGVLGPAIARADGGFQPSAGADPTLARLLAGKLRSRAARKYLPRRAHRLADVDWVTGACLFIRRKAWQAVGGFDDRFFLYYDEVDLCRRVRAAGFRVRYDPSLEVTHLAPYHDRPREPALDQIIGESRARYFSKHRPRWEGFALACLTRMERLLGRGRVAQPPAGLAPDRPDPAAV